MRKSLLVNLRIAATLSHRLSFGVTLRHAGRTLFDVDYSCRRAAEQGARWMAPCGFRVSVADAWRLQREGRGIALSGVPAAEDPEVDLRPPLGGAVWPGGIYEVPVTDRILYVFPTTAGLAPCRDAAGASGLDLHVDPLLGVILVQSSVGVSQMAARVLARDALLSVAGQLVVSEMLDDMATGVSN